MYRRWVWGMSCTPLTSFSTMRGFSITRVFQYVFPAAVMLTVLSAVSFDVTVTEAYRFRQRNNSLLSPPSFRRYSRWASCFELRWLKAPIWHHLCVFPAQEGSIGIWWNVQRPLWFSTSYGQTIVQVRKYVLRTSIWINQFLVTVCT